MTAAAQPILDGCGLHCRQSVLCAQNVRRGPAAGDAAMLERPVRTRSSIRHFCHQTSNALAIQARKADLHFFTIAKHG